MIEKFGTDRQKSTTGPRKNQETLMTREQKKRGKETGFDRNEDDESRGEKWDRICKEPNTLGKRERRRGDGFQEKEAASK